MTSELTTHTSATTTVSSTTSLTSMHDNIVTTEPISKDILHVPSESIEIEKESVVTESSEVTQHNHD